MYYIYILYSASSDIFYVGYSSDIPGGCRNIISRKISIRSRLSIGPGFYGQCLSVGEDEKIAIGLEHFIKKQKSRKLLEQLCDAQFIPTGKLSQLVRVPDVRD